jgi:DNA-binding beta-propeller fold protein YncE
VSARPVRRRNAAAAIAAALALAAVPAVASATGSGPVKSFRPLTSFNVPGGGVAEIVSASPDGRTLVYTDSGAEAVGLVDISRPKAPRFVTSIEVGGEPTSVSVTKGGKAVVAVRRDVLEEGAPPELKPGALLVIDLASGAVEAEHEIGHHPDSVATGVWKGTPYAVVAIENEPVVVDGDGNLTDEEEPGHPGDVSGPGIVQVVNLADGTVHDIPLALGEGFAFADDPQPEFVDINKRTAIVSVQENNGYVAIDVPRALRGLGAGAILRSFGAGTAVDRKADLQDDDTVSFTENYPSDVADEPHAGLRFPDAIAFTKNGRYVLSADEGEFDYTGGRGWSVRSREGDLVWQDGGSLERAAVMHGLYPDGRSDAKGIEVEGVETGTFGRTEYAFVGSERGSFVAVYKMWKDGSEPRLVQLLPTGVGPEGILAIPGRKLFVTSDEETGDISIFGGVPYVYKGTKKRPVVRSMSVRTPWSAVSGLAGDATKSSVLWGVPDNALPSELYRIDLDGKPAKLTSRAITKDGEQARYDLEGIVADTSMAAPRPPRALAKHRTAAKRARSSYRRASQKGQVALARRAKRALTFHRARIRTHTQTGFWLAQEGNAAFGEDSYLANLLIQVNRKGEVLKEIPLPAEIDSPTGGVIRGNGFEGVTLSHDGRYLLAAVQRDYASDADVDGARHTRIARYDLKNESWDFFLYPLDGPVAEGWVGLSEIVSVGRDRYLVIERDQQVGGAAEVKRIYEFGLKDVEPTDGAPIPEGTTPEDLAGKVVQKALYQDVVEEFGPFEKLEGLAITRSRNVWGNVDNDGGEHESRFLRLGPLKGAKGAPPHAAPLQRRRVRPASQRARRRRRPLRHAGPPGQGRRVRVRPKGAAGRDPSLGRRQHPARQGAQREHRAGHPVLRRGRVRPHQVRRHDHRQPRLRPGSGRPGGLHHELPEQEPGRAGALAAAVPVGQPRRLGRARPGRARGRGAHRREHGREGARPQDRRRGRDHAEPALHHDDAQRHGRRRRRRGRAA